MSPAPDQQQRPGKPNKLVALIKRKPLEAIGAFAAVAVIGVALWQHHLNAQAQQAGGAGTGPAFIAPAGPRGGSRGGSRGGQNAALEAQLDRLQRQRNPHHNPARHNRDHDPGGRRLPPRRRRMGGHGGPKR